MILGFDHTGMVVNNLDESIELFEKIGFVVENCFDVPEENGKAVTLRHANSELELFEFDHPAAPLAQIVKNHIGFVTDNMEEDIEIFKENGYEIVMPITAGKVVKRKAFVKSPEGNVIELVEK